MNTYQLIAIAFVIVILICIIAQMTRKKPRTTEALLSASVGIMDAPAREAFTRLQRENLTPGERIARANIIRYNVIENNPRDERMRDVVMDYRRAVRDIALGDNVGPIPNLETVFNLRHEFGDVWEPHGDLLREDPMLDMLNMLFLDGAPQMAQEQITMQTAQHHRDNAPNKAIAVNNALTAPMRNDPQSVHDPKASETLNQTLRVIKSNADTDRMCEEAERFLRQDENSSALPAFNEMMRNGYVSTYQATEKHIVAQVWARIHHPQNEDSQDDLKDAFVDALKDAAPNGVVVCANGRCGRVLGCLATLDFDPRAGNIMTFEAIKHDVLRDTNTAFEEELTALEDDPSMEELVASYVDPSTTAPEEQITRFRDIMRRRINEALDEHDSLTPNERERLISECLVYIAM